MLGARPYNGGSRQEIRDHILAEQVQIKPSEVPEGWSDQGVDFINKMIQRVPEKRLGYKGIQEVKDHMWLAQFPWKKFQDKKLKSPFKPAVEENIKL